MINRDWELGLLFSRIGRGVKVARIGVRHAAANQTVDLPTQGVPILGTTRDPGGRVGILLPVRQSGAGRWSYLLLNSDCIDGTAYILFLDSEPPKGGDQT